MIKKQFQLSSSLSEFSQHCASLLFPNYCVVCEQALHVNESHLCLVCIHSLPKLDFDKWAQNPIAKLFYDQKIVTEVCAWIAYKKEGPTQQVLKHLKYLHCPSIGSRLGEILGKDLFKVQRFNADLIVPVPLHKKRMRTRSYNQAAELAKGIGIGLSIPVSEFALKRSSAAKSQTKKNRLNRWQKIQSAFSVNEKLDKNALEGKTIILVDDVITTGATLSACVAALKKAKVKEVKVVALAFARM